MELRISWILSILVLSATVTHEEVIREFQNIFKSENYGLVVAYEQGDYYAREIVDHLNISHMFYKVRRDWRSFILLGILALEIRSSILSVCSKNPDQTIKVKHIRFS